MAVSHKRLHPLAEINLILLLFFLVTGGLYIARALLIPLAYATILTMLLAPLCQKLEAQLIENNILEPYIVGAEVNIHPFFTIVVIIAGEAIWGISGFWLFPYWESLESLWKILTSWNPMPT